METKNIPNFVHLHVHTQYSLLDGAIRLDKLLDRTAEFGMNSVAITDHGSMHGALEFYEKANKAGIKPVIGCEYYIAPRQLTDKTPQDGKGFSHLILLAENQEGYRNLCKLCTIAQLEGFYYKPRIDNEVLQQHTKGLIALSACLQGEVPRKILAGNIKQADEAAHFYMKIFGENNFFLEVQNNGIDAQEKVNHGLLDMSKRLSIPLVASNDCHYLNKEDVRAHEVLLCIQTSKTMNDPGRFKFSTDQLYFKSPQEMYESFADYPGALDNTVDIANRCNLEFDFNTYHFPKFDTGSKLTVNETFEQTVRTGYEKRLSFIKKKYPDIDEQVYSKRLEYETSVIKEMGFAGYFLIVADFIKYSKENNIPVGPGRGSAAGSIVAYSMGITDLDPIEHGLIFERFLNPARMSMPDIDVDFCINGREKVFKYVVEKYGGGDYVAQIITFGKLKSRAVIRDVGRALDIPLHQVDTIAKMVPDVINISLDNALKQEPKLAQAVESNPQIAELIKICRVLEGLPRHASTHAAGVVIGDKPLVEYLPLYKGKKGEVVTQFDMKLVEHIGLVKFDFLGLRNLTVIKDTLDLIKDQKRECPDLLDLDLNDLDTYKRILASGDTTGVFQLESSGMKELMVRLKPTCFDDITALVALYRPGPLDSGMVDDFVERKHGRKTVQYIVPELEPILKSTYGVIVYQEQVMKIAVSLAGYSMADADGLRKAMGKKIPKIMAEHRELFMTGAEKNKIPTAKAKQIFDLMEKFGGYGFNKSHSAAYALIAFQTAFLKTHYSVEFMAALLTSEMHSSDGVVKYITECRDRAIDVLPPDINESHIGFTVTGSKIRFGLVAVKNVGQGAIELILEARKQGKFVSLFDFCERLDLRKVNKRVMESLIKCGAFDSFEIYRSRLMQVLENAIDYGQRIQKEKSDPQMSLFSVQSSKQSKLDSPAIPEIDEWDQKSLLNFEKEALGFYITGHPLSEFEHIVQKFTNANTLSIKEMDDGQIVRISGMIIKIKTITTKKGDLMAFLTIEDMHGSIEIVVFSSIYSNVEEILVPDKGLLIQGQVKQDEKGSKILADEIIEIEKAEEKWVASLHLSLNASQTNREIFTKLNDIFKQHPGNCEVYLHLLSPENIETIIGLPDSFKLNSGPKLTHEINTFLGYDAVKSVCSVGLYLKFLVIPAKARIHIKP